MNIALVGYGKMGRMIEAAALSRSHSISCRIDPKAGDADFSSIAEAKVALEEAELVIEFSHPSVVEANLHELIALRKSLVVGTTGWLDKLPVMRRLVEEAGTALLWSPNFSLGVNLFYKIVEEAARLLDPYAEYDAGGWEAHHNRKADSPSGTAKAIVERVLSSMTRKTQAVYETLENRPPEPHELHYPSLRLGSVPGTHTVFFDSNADTIELTHTARSREGFATGAVVAAEWLMGKRGIFTMDDVLS